MKVEIFQNFELCPKLTFFFLHPVAKVLRFMFCILSTIGHYDVVMLVKRSTGHHYLLPCWVRLLPALALNVEIRHKLSGENVKINIEG